jgi:hypothetical protein
MRNKVHHQRSLTDKEKYERYRLFLKKDRLLNLSKRALRDYYPRLFRDRESFYSLVDALFHLTDEPSILSEDIRKISDFTDEQIIDIEKLLNTICNKINNFLVRYWEPRNIRERQRIKYQVILVIDEYFDLKWEAVNWDGTIDYPNGNIRES